MSLIKKFQMLPTTRVHTLTTKGNDALFLRLEDLPSGYDRHMAGGQPFRIDS
jgi:hypothetical protein